MRLFVGIELSGRAREAVIEARSQLVNAVDHDRQGVRFVKPEKLHLTLAFLGNVSDADLDALKSSLDGVEARPFPLTLTDVGAFPDLGRPKVIWIGLAGDTVAAVSLASQVSIAAKPFAPELDEKPFAPHITIARVKPGSKEVGRIVADLKVRVRHERLDVDAFALFLSRPDGEYEVLHRVSLPN